MTIPEAQLDTWSHQGTVPQSSATYNTVKSALESSGSDFAGKDFSVFLQGSYGNDTNIYAESDVDIVIKLNSCFRHNVDKLPSDQIEAFNTVHSNAGYTHVEFKRDVLSHLKTKYAADVNSGDKAISIAANGSRRKADVIAAIQYRRYSKFLNLSDQAYTEGICFFNGAGSCIANYPKLHSLNCTTKQQATKGWFKPMVRVLKNMRGKMIEEKMIKVGDAPSYFLEGLLYNAPNDKFVGSYQDTFVNCINWLQGADRSKFSCANEQYKLLCEDSPVTWRDNKCNEFLTAASKLWNQW